jgi:hypothetical protein
MKRTTLIPMTVALTTVLFQSQAPAQSIPKLHVNPRWKECSFQIDPSLTQAAWRQFTREAGLVAYFRPLADARTIGKGKFEVSGAMAKTGINDADAAWNDTFVHPDSTHVLFEGDGLEFPGLMMRAGVTGNTDVNVYLTKNPGANYGFYGAQVQHALTGADDAAWATSARLSFVSIYGPDDLDFSVYGADMVASRQVKFTRWASVSPYAGVSGYLARSHEKTAAVSLEDEHVLGAAANIGAAVQLSAVRFAIEYNVARVNSLSIKAGVGF